MARARRKKIDTWKTKKAYDIMAPPMFEGKKIAETMATDPKTLMGRTITVTMKELSGDFSKQHIKVQFQINDVKGNQALTRFKGQALSRDYMRSQIRRKTTRVEAVIDVTTKDGHDLRVKVIGLAIGRAQTSQERLIRKLMAELVKEEAQKTELDQFVQDAVRGKISIFLYRKLNKIYPLKRVEVRKIKVLTSNKAAA